MLLAGSASCTLIRFILIGAVVTASEAKPWSPSSSPYNASSLLAANIVTTAPNCPSRCGNLTGSYPFGIGIGSGCSMDSQLDINCDTSYNPPKAHLNFTYVNLESELLHISDTQLWVRNHVFQTCAPVQGSITSELVLVFNQTIPFHAVSLTANEITVVGCNDYVTSVELHDNTTTSMGACVSLCSHKEDVRAGACSGIDWCRSSLPRGATVFHSWVRSLSVNESVAAAYGGCSYIFVGERGKYKFEGLEDLEDPGFAQRVEETVPAVLEWTVKKGIT